VPAQDDHARRSRVRTPADLLVLVLTGAGMTVPVRTRTVPVLAEHVEVLAWHARRPAEPGDAGTAVARLADEAAAVLDRAGRARAVVYGVSFGGMVAQQVALRHPERVEALVLAATTAGGDLRVEPDPDARDFLARRAELPAEEGLWASVPYSYALLTRRRHARRIGEDIVQRLRDPLDPEDHRHQRAAALAHDATDGLGSIAVPTLVLHGEEDRMVPPENARLLAERIPGARLEVLPDAAHLLPTDRPEADRAVVRFVLEEVGAVSRQRRPRSGPAARA
jgi:3-oxoadipate enol-lactonase